MDANEGLRETVDEDKHVRRGPDSRQSLVENLWIDYSKFAMMRWINTRDRLPCICERDRQQTRRSQEILLSICKV